VQMTAEIFSGQVAGIRTGPQGKQVSGTGKTG
jgi:hypothetical protein